MTSSGLTSVFSGAAGLGIAHLVPARSEVPGEVGLGALTLQLSLLASLLGVRAEVADVPAGVAIVFDGPEGVVDLQEGL